MSSCVKTLKCASCNLVISELLAFVQNKVDTMDNESIVRICVSAFSPHEVEVAKGLLFDTIKTKRKNISRRKDGKTQRELEDIITVFKETDPDSLPTYVARELHRLPPVTFDHVDVTALLKDILLLKTDVEMIKQNYVSTKQVEELENKIINSRYASVTSPVYNNVNTKRGACLLDSGPMAILTSGSDTYNEISLGLNNVSEKTEVISCASANRTRKQSPEAVTLTGGNDRNCVSRSHTQAKAHDNTVSTLTLPHDQVMQETNENTKRKISYAEVVNMDTQWKNSKRDDSWILVEDKKKRSRNRFIGNKGKAESMLTNKFKAADSKVPLFISNVHTDVLESDIVEYIYEKTNETVSLSKIKMKHQRDYNSYKIFVTKHKLDVFLDDKLWPCGISFRRFVDIRRRNINEISERKLKEHDGDKKI